MSVLNFKTAWNTGLQKLKGMSQPDLRQLQCFAQVLFAWMRTYVTLKGPTANRKAPLPQNFCSPGTVSLRSETLWLRCCEAEYRRVKTWNEVFKEGCMTRDIDLPYTRSHLSVRWKSTILLNFTTTNRVEGETSHRTFKRSIELPILSGMGSAHWARCLMQSPNQLQ